MSVVVGRVTVPVFEIVLITGDVSVLFVSVAAADRSVTIAPAVAAALAAALLSLMAAADALELALLAWVVAVLADVVADDAADEAVEAADVAVPAWVVAVVAAVLAVLALVLTSPATVFACVDHVLRSPSVANAFVLNAEGESAGVGGSNVTVIVLMSILQSQSNIRSNRHR